MSEQEKRSEEDPKEAKTEKGKGPGESKDKKGLDYVFKIASADPKNAFNFEDVADK